MRNVILVLGMHRSGTSAAAGFLVKLGGAQPRTLMPAEGGNERGYFESQALMTFHEELLASAGSSWTDWRQFNPAWYQSPTGAAFRKRAKQLFKEEFDGEPLAVLKDPRVCRFAPFWLEVLAGIKARAGVVIPVRSPLEVAFSMRKRNDFSLATGALLWLRHIIDAEIASRTLPRSIFTWDQLLWDWRSVAEKTSRELGLPWPRLTDATAHEIENFIGHDLVHHRVSASELAAHSDIHEWTMSAYRAMLKLARAPRSRSALKQLDKIRDAFNRASRMFGRTVLEDEVRSQYLLRETAKLAAERDHWLRQHDAARAELAEVLEAKEQILLELNARAREANDLAQALAEQRCQREQAELALAREKSLNVEVANDLPSAAPSEITETQDAKKERHVTEHALGFEQARSKNSIAELKPVAEGMQAIETLSTGRTQPSQNPRRDARFHLHRLHFLEYVDPSKERGLEIGAFDLPLVEPSEGRCDLADWNSIEYLRDLAERQPGHNPDFVAPVQFNLRQGYDQIPEGYDWICASHVIEQVPDIIGWLSQMASKLRAGGILFLVIPDKRYTYDIYRRESRFTDALLAHRSALKHPSFAQVFDHFYYSAPGVIAHDVWAGNPIPGPKLDFAESLMLAERAEHAYSDAHCWVLTPDSFLALTRSLTDAHMTNFQLVDLRPTAPGMLDFSVVLRK
jgi:hypothetical protein